MCVFWDGKPRIFNADPEPERKSLEVEDLDSSQDSCNNTST